MKGLFLLLLIISFSCAVNAQDDESLGAFQIAIGYTPNQTTSLDIIGNAVSFDIMAIELFNDLVGFGYGVGIKSYNKIQNNVILNSDDPYKQSVTRFDVHIGPVFLMRASQIGLLLSPQVGLWYAGMSNVGPKVNFTTVLNADLLLGIITIGISYSALSRRLVSTNWSIYNPQNSYVLIKPALEFRVGIFI